MEVEVFVIVTYGSSHTILCARPRTGGGCFTGASMAYYHVTFPFFEGRVIALGEGFPLGYSFGHPIAASDVMTWPGLCC